MSDEIERQCIRRDAIHELGAYLLNDGAGLIRATCSLKAGLRLPEFQRGIQDIEHVSDCDKESLDPQALNGGCSEIFSIGARWRNA